MIYLLRRVLYALPILIGVNIITFLLFFVVNTPDSMARMQLGERYVSQTAIEQWKHQRGYNKPLFFNHQQEGSKKLTDTVFFQKSIKLFVFDFGISDAGRNIGYDVSQRMWPSLAIAIPTLLLGLIVQISVAMFIIFFRHTALEFWSVVLLVVMMSISGMFYVIAGQFLFARLLNLAPVSGYTPDASAIRFVILPILIGVVAGIGSGGRWYRTLMLEEINKDYVKAARARGLSEWRILARHVLPNVMIPILTGVVAVLPLLFLGSLLMESFFAIPGLGSYVIDAIQSQDFAIVRTIVFLGAVLYILGLILTDIAYTLADPRVRLT